MLTTLFISLAVVFAVLLVLVILAQNSKGGGLSSQFGGSSASNLIGVKKTGDLLEKLTWGFVILIMVASLASAKLDQPATTNSNNMLDRAKEQQPPALPAPALDLGTPSDQQENTLQPVDSIN